MMMTKPSKVVALILLLVLFQQNQSVLSLPFHPKKPPASDSATVDVIAESSVTATAALTTTTTTTTTALALLQAEFLRRAPGLALAGLLSFGFSDPLVEEFFNVTHLTWNKGSYRSTFLYAAADSMACAGKVYGTLQLLDWLLSIFPKLQSYFPIQADLTVVAPHVGVTLWAARSIAKVKNLLIKKAVYGTRYGKVAVLDRLLDYSIAIAAGYNIVHQLQINMGLGLRSLFAASGASALVLSLASKGMIEQLVAGLLLQAWDAIEEGEYVKLSDGTEGTIASIGLLETEIVGDDHVPMRVPNTMIIGKKVSLYSKVTKSQVNQILRFKYSDLDKIPKLIRDITAEIETRCTYDNLDKPPSVTLVKYEADHIQVECSVEFNLKPTSTEFVNMREQVLFSIADATKRNGVQFAIPAIQYETRNGGGDDDHDDEHFLSS